MTEIAVTVLGKVFNCDEYVAYPMKDVKDRSLRELFDLFKTLLPDHPDEENTKLYFLKDTGALSGVHLLWVCEHFEGSSTLEVSGLSHFLQEMQWHFGAAEIHVALLDGFWEKLLLQAYNVPFEYPAKPGDIHNKNVDYGDEEALGGGGQ